MSQEFRFKNVDETRNYLLEEIKHQELMSKYIIHWRLWSFYKTILFH